MGFPALGWVILALVFGIAELAIPAFVCLFFSVGGIVAALVALRFGPGAQLAAFAISLLGSLALLRPRLLATIHSRKKILSRTEAIIGKVGSVTERIDPHGAPGRVLVEGQDWAASATEPIEPGERIEIMGADGIVLNVRRK